MFKYLDTTKPQYARSVYSLTEAALIHEREYNLASKYITDPLSLVNKAADDFQRGVEYAKTSPSQEVAIQAFESLYIGKINRLLTILRESGRADEELAVLELAQSKVGDPRIQKMLKGENAEHAPPMDAR